MKKNNNISENIETKETGRTIKNKRTVNKTENVKPKNLGWKEQMKLDFINGAKITPQNEEQQKYLDLLKNKEEKHKSYLARVSEKAKEKLASIKINADAQYERILEKAIKVEEQLNSFGEKFAKVKEVVAKKLKESAEEKRKKRREAWLNRSIPTPEILEANKKQQEFLAKAHAVKLEEMRARLDAREKELKEHKKVKSEEEKQKQRDKRKEKAMKKALTKLHSHDGGIDLKHTTKEQRIEAIKDDKAARKAEYLKMVQLHESEVAANPKAAQERKEKRKRTEAERLAMIAERRKERMERKIVVELSQKKKTQNDIKRFIESEKARLVRKEEKRATYLTKGGIRVPKVKNKVEARPNDIPFEKIAMATNYYVIARITDKETIIDTKPNMLIYKEGHLEQKLLKKHNELLKKEPETYVGIYCYSDKELTNCIMEFVNDKFKDINSRMEKSLAA